MKKLVLFILLFPVLLCSHAAIIMKPYLQAVTTKSIYVMVECDSRDTVIVNYGSTAQFGSLSGTGIISVTTADPPTYVHKILLSGLAPGQQYYYQAFQGTSTFPVSDFHTSVVSGTPFRFTWMADFRTGVEVHDTISGLMLEANSVVSFYGGDLCYNEGYDSWKKEFFRRKQLELMARVPFFNTPGNHEGWKENAKAFTRNPESTSNTQDYYSFDYGDLHVLSINYLIPYDQKSPQYKFAQADLEGSKAAWKIVICHAPAYGVGGHGSDKNLEKMSRKLFEPNNVKIVIAGHSHFYQHNFVDGIHHLIIGSAGAPLYNPGQASYTKVAVKDYNWAVGEVSPGKFTITVYNTSGKILDVIELQK